MALDYMIDQPCKVKEALTVDGLVSSIKQRNRGLAIIDMMMKDGRSEEEAFGSAIKVQVHSPDGMQVKEVKVADMLSGALRLSELRAHCNGCPASGGSEFGCYRSISYPISGKAEEWLAGIAKSAADSKGLGMLPLQFILERKMDGGPFSRMRANPNGMFFELRLPLEIKVDNGLLNRGVVTTDQVFNLIAGMGRMKCPHMEMLLYFSGALATADEEPKPDAARPAFPMASRSGKKFWATYDLRDAGSDDASIRQLKGYFRALFVAYAHQRDMIISQ